MLVDYKAVPYDATVSGSAAGCGVEVADGPAGVRVSHDCMLVTMRERVKNSRGRTWSDLSDRRFTSPPLS